MVQIVSFYESEYIIMSTKKTTKSTELVANATKVNTNTNDILSLVDMTEFLQNSVIGTKCKVFTDSKFYAGFGVKCNGFSVNTKKTKYNIYCNDTCLSVFGKITESTDKNGKVKKSFEPSATFDGVVFTLNGNVTDKTRPNFIECKNTESLKTLVNMVLTDVYKVATDTN